MSRHQNILIAAAAALVSTTLIVPTSGVLAQSWTTVTHNNMPIVEGSGRVVQQNRAVSDFRAVETLGSEDVEVRFGPHPSLVIAADDNILPLISSEIHDGTLTISSRGSYRMRGPIKVWITTPRLESLTSAGSGNVVIHNLSNDRLKLAMKGSGEVQADGRTGTLELALYGSGNARLATLAAESVDAGLYGSGNAVVRASQRLDAKVFGSGTLRYVGNPPAIRRSVAGSGEIVAAR